MEEFATSSSSDLLGRWQAALQKVFTVTGWWYDPATGSLTDLVNRVVVNLEGGLEAKPRDRDGGKIGIQERVSELVKLLKSPDMQKNQIFKELCCTSLLPTGKKAGKNELQNELQGRASSFLSSTRA
ncbi:hypothetical protein WJX72_010680 [[Myrmecia] bisecta]|uniref:Uncharacterized protein n=1 Tax=[Myrmecia] bisecta TaxID=41462 RepID=A0AAW1R8D6_9CHLO